VSPLLDKVIESVSKSMCMTVNIVERTEKNSCGFTSLHHMLRVCVYVCVCWGGVSTQTFQELVVG
jgi:hypothetical protein